MLDTIHKSLEELLSNFYSVIPWLEIGLIVGVVRACEASSRSRNNINSR